MTTVLSAKGIEVENKIPYTSSLVTSSLVTTTVLNTKINEAENKILGQSKYIAT